jgi:hypothetical protein
LQTGRNAPFIFDPPCQSELKRTLRRGDRPAITAYSQGFNPLRGGSFDADGERQVSSPIDLWFRNGGRADYAHFFVFADINRKFTPNRIIRNFSEFSPSLAQCKHLRFIDG